MKVLELFFVRIKLFHAGYSNFDLSELQAENEEEKEEKTFFGFYLIRFLALTVYVMGIIATTKFLSDFFQFPLDFSAIASGLLVGFAVWFFGNCLYNFALAKSEQAERTKLIQGLELSEEIESNE